MRLYRKYNGAAGYQSPVKIELRKGAGLLTFSCFLFQTSEIKLDFVSSWCDCGVIGDKYLCKKSSLTREFVAR